MVKIYWTGRFSQLLDKLCFENPDFEVEVNQRIHWFSKNPKDTRLDNHSLTKKMQGKWAFSVTDDIRIVYELLGRNAVRFLDIGPHSKVYKKQSPKR